MEEELHLKQDVSDTKTITSYDKNQFDQEPNGADRGISDTNTDDQLLLWEVEAKSGENEWL